MPIAGGLGELFGLLPRPDFLQWTNPAIYTAGFTIATMATLETLLNLGRSIGWIRSNGPRAEPGIIGSRHRKRGLWIGRRTSRHFRGHPGVGKRQRRWKNETGHRHSRHVAVGQRSAHTDLAEYDPVILSRGDFDSDRH